MLPCTSFSSTIVLEKDVQGNITALRTDKMCIRDR